MKIKVLLITGLFLLMACQRQPKPAIAPKTYKNILKELILINLLHDDLSLKDSISFNLQNQVYKKYHVDSLQLKQNTAYYAEHPKDLIKIYEQIYNELKKKADSLNKLVSSSKKQKKTAPVKVLEKLVAPAQVPH